MSAKPSTVSFSTFSIREARRLIHDCFRPRPAIYWADMLVTTGVGYAAAAMYFAAEAFSPLQLAALAVAGLALFRAGTFIHEIVHMRHGQQLWFQSAWNLLCGVPMLMPSFLYENHADHHNAHHYGTPRDGEYLAIGAPPVTRLWGYFAQVLLLPPLVVARFVLLTPLSFCHPRLRQWTLERASFYGINPYYRREIPPHAPRKVWALLEIACFLRAAAIPGVVIAQFHPWTRMVQLYVLAVVVIGLNYIRNLAAHRYRNTGDRMSYTDQLEDSLNIEGHPLLTELLFPLGLRYHALHHLFPGIPYHALGTAHRRLMRELPADSPYRRTVAPSFLAAARQLWRDAHGAAPAAAAQRAA